MDSWVSHMPKGMFLKSDGFASSIYDPDGEYSLKTFCAERGIEYADSGLPVRLDTFSSYGLSFANRMVPELEDKLVVSLDRSSAGFVLRLDDGEEVTARRVILAIGITHFKYTPQNLTHLSRQFLSHSFDHHDLEPFRSRKVVVIGGGASAIDLAGLLCDSDADVQLVARQPTLQFHTRAHPDEARSLWHRISHPRSGIGGGIKLRFYADTPNLFHYLPERTRLKIVRTSLGPSGGWFAKDRVMGRIPLSLGCTPVGAEVEDNQIRLRLRAADGSERELTTEHIIAATGYRVDLKRLTFINPAMLSSLAAVDGTPILSSTFESSVPGLYFAGAAAANSFGPVLRFAYGARFAAMRVTEAMERFQVHGHSLMPVHKISPPPNNHWGRETRFVDKSRVEVTSTGKKGPVSTAYRETPSLKVCSSAGASSAVGTANADSVRENV